MGNKLFSSKKQASEEKWRVIFPVTYNLVQQSPEDHELNPAYKGNKVKTTKYTFYNFIFKNFWEQLHTFANIFFIFIVILNFMPEVEAFAKEVAPVPVLIVLTLTGVVDAVEDIRRYFLDKKINQTHTRSYSIEHDEFKVTTWEKLRPGDFVRLRANEVIPADILVLKSSDNSGLCHIETANLDGENNLKQREVVKNLTFIPREFSQIVEVEAPKSDIYLFNGRITIADTRYSLGRNNLLLRGCVLRNTEYVEGMVIYAGHESKAMLNNTGPRFKQSKLEARMNKDMIYCVLILAIVCLTGAVGSFIWQQGFPSTNVLFLALNPNSYISSPAFQAFINFWTFIIIFQSIIPLPLYVTLKMVKAAQLWFMANDQQMYDPTTDKRLEVHAFNIPEDLGQIQYVFCDKTGTLTENKMEFRMASINGQHYRFTENLSSDLPGVVCEEGTLTSNAQQHQISMMSLSRSLLELRPLVQSISFCETRDSLLRNYESFSGTPQIEAKLVAPIDTLRPISSSSAFLFSAEELRIQDFFIALAICNTAVVSLNKNNPVPLAMSAQSTKKMPAWKEKMGSVIGRRDGRGSVTSLFKGLRNSKKNLAAETTAQDSPTAKPTSAIRSSGHVLDTVVESDRQSDNSTVLSKPKFILSSDEYANVVTEADEASSVASYLSRAENSESTSENIERFSGEAMETKSKLLPTPEESKMFTDEQLMNSYESESPDELCLVKMACHLGCKLLKRGPDYVQIWLPELGMRTLEVLHILPFDSTRKRMSVVIRHPITQEAILYTKGADCAILPRLCKSSAATNSCNRQHFVHSANSHIDLFSREGLRTLVIAKRILTDQQYRDWSASYRAAETSLEDNSDLIAQLTNELESDLHLLGATGIEDKLQEAVPDTIQALRDAGINVWVLTGDKQETAINIAYSARLVSEDQCLLKINTTDTNETREQLIRCVREVRKYFQTGQIDLPPNLIYQMSEVDRPARTRRRRSSKKRRMSNVSLHSSDNWDDCPQDVFLEEEDTISCIDINASGDTPNTQISYMNGVEGGPSRSSPRRQRKPRRSSTLEAPIVSWQNETSNSGPQISVEPADRTRRFSRNSRHLRTQSLKRNTMERKKHFALVLDGDTLKFALEKKNRGIFMKLCDYCVSVVCCRATPLQKADVVKYVKQYLEVQTLAIGDGANDVNMIQTADVGIGIGGQEGMQAVMASDYAISQFRFLARLLLVHGHWCYDKLARTALYIIYKDAIYIFVMFWFQLFNGFSGSSPFDQLSQVLFAVTMTGIPPFILGIWDNHLDADTLMANPCIYQDGQHSRSYQPWHFWCNILDAIWQSLAIYFITYLIFLNSDIGMWEFGLIQMNILIAVTLIHLAIEFRHWTVIQLFSLVVSYCVFWLTFMFIYHAVAVTSIKPECPYWIIYKSMSGPYFWLCMLLIIPGALLPRFATNALWNCVNPTLSVAAAIFIQKGKYARGDKMPLLSKYLRSHKFKRSRGKRGPKDTLEVLETRTLSQTDLCSELEDNASPVRFVRRIKQVCKTGFQLVRAVPGIATATETGSTSLNPNESQVDQNRPRSTSDTINRKAAEQSLSKPERTSTVRVITPNDFQYDTSTMPIVQHRRVQSYSETTNGSAVSITGPTQRRIRQRRSESQETREQNESMPVPVPYSVLFPDKLKLDPATRL